MESEWLLGPIVFPYSATDIYGNYITGGTDPNLFYPIVAGNLNIFVQLLGPGLNPNNGAYFTIEEVVLGKGFNISYQLRLKATGEVP